MESVRFSTMGTAPQAHLNAFVPPASRDWSAHEWREGDFVRHFAGCPWQDLGVLFSMAFVTAHLAQEPHCLGLMQETAAYAEQQLRLSS